MGSARCLGSSFDPRRRDRRGETEGDALRGWETQFTGKKTRDGTFDKNREGGHGARMGALAPGGYQGDRAGSRVLAPGDSSRCGWGPAVEGGECGRAAHASGGGGSPQGPATGDAAGEVWGPEDKPPALRDGPPHLPSTSLGLLAPAGPRWPFVSPWVVRATEAAADGSLKALLSGSRCPLPGGFWAQAGSPLPQTAPPLPPHPVPPSSRGLTPASVGQ